MWCDGERNRYEKEEEERIKMIRTEEAWKYINRYRKKRERIDEKIKMESWYNHFKELLEGSKKRTTMEEEGNKEMEEKGERTETEYEDDEISDEEIIKQIRELKKEKASEENGIENEAWRWMSKEIGEVLAAVEEDIERRRNTEGLEQRSNKLDLQKRKKGRSGEL